jgi:tetratricopeptide (TPR) repeat protein
MEKTPADRYVTAQEMADDLRRFLADEPIRAKRPGRWARGRKWARRHQPVVAAAAVCLLVTLAALVGSVGWALGDRTARQREAEGKVREALEAAGPGLRQGNPWDPALIAAVQRAEAQLGGSLVGQELRRQVEQLRKDVQMLAELERIRLDPTGWLDGHFDRARLDAQFASAFRDYGIDVDALGPEGAAALVQRSAIREYLVAGLDDWGDVHSRRGQEGIVRRASHLMAVARLADPDPWRNRLRDVVLSRDTTGLEQLARSAPAEELPAATLGLLGHLIAPANKQSSGPMVELLRHAQQRFPADFWINHELALALAQGRPPRQEEVIGFLRAAVALRPLSAGAHLNLGVALHRNKELDAAIAEFREAIRLQQAFSGAHINLGNALVDKKDLDGAIAEYKKAINLDPKDAKARNNLGAALHDKGDLDGAIAEWRVVIEIDPKRALAHTNLGIALGAKGDLDGAIAEHREAVRLKNDSPNAHYNFGIALQARRRMNEAIAEYREAIRLKEDHAEAHCDLGELLRDKGQFAEALTHLRRGHELGSKTPGWRHRSADWVKRCERLVELDAKLPRVLKGEVKPAGVDERLALAQFCQLPCKVLHAAAARLYTDAFAEQPKLADDLQGQFRYNAARSAALAGCGQGKDADQSDDKERVRLRGQTLEWLRADLAACRRLLEKEPDKAGPLVRDRMRHWQQDKDFAGVRDPGALTKLPEAEHQQWQKLWADVADTLTRAEGKAASNKPRPGS